jgi:hypothetical protein
MPMVGIPPPPLKHTFIADFVCFFTSFLICYEYLSLSSRITLRRGYFQFFHTHFHYGPSPPSLILCFELARHRSLTSIHPLVTLLPLSDPFLCLLYRVTHFHFRSVLSRH